MNSHKPNTSSEPLSQSQSTSTTTSSQKTTFNTKTSNTKTTFFSILLILLLCFTLLVGLHMVFAENTALNATTLAINIATNNPTNAAIIILPVNENLSSLLTGDVVLNALENLSIQPITEDNASNTSQNTSSPIENLSTPSNTISPSEPALPSIPIPPTEPAPSEPSTNSSEQNNHSEQNQTITPSPTPSLTPSPIPSPASIFVLLIDKLNAFIGEIINIQAILTYENDTPISGQTIEFYQTKQLQDQLLGSAVTNSFGKAEFNWNTSINNEQLAERFFEIAKSWPDSPKIIKQKLLDLLEIKFKQWGFPLSAELVQKVKSWKI